MINVAIVEDDERERGQLVDYLNRYADKFTIETFSSAVDFLTNFVPKYDIVFMDIDMPYLDGMSAAHALRERDRQVCLIFVTNLAKFAVKGYEVSAFDFIVKPVTYSNFSLKINRAMNHLSTKTDRAVMVRSGGNIAKVSVKSILYVEVMNHKIIYHTIDGNIVSYGTLKSVEQLLCDPLFVRCNKCYLVNLRFVFAIEGNYVVVGEDKLLISYPRKAEFERALADYLCGGK